MCPRSASGTLRGTLTKAPSAPEPIQRITVLGLPVDSVDMASALARIDGFLQEDRPHLVVTADASGFVIAQDDVEFAEIVRGADLVTPDSYGVVWAARKRGYALAGQVTGVELVDRLCARSAEHGTRLFFLGAAPGVAEEAAERLRLKHPGCNIVGTRHGYFPADSDEVVAQEVAAAKPDVLLVAMGIPRQEKFIRKTEHLIKARVAMGVGGSFDVYSGRTRRAPKLVQRLHLEWLWRVLLNPTKFQKVKTLPVFALKVLREK